MCELLKESQDETWAQCHKTGGVLLSASLQCNTDPNLAGSNFVIMPLEFMYFYT